MRSRCHAPDLGAFKPHVRSAAGDRVILPAVAEPRRTSSWLPVVIAAGILLVGLILRQHPAPLPIRVDANSTSMLDHASASGFLSQSRRRQLLVASSPEEALNLLDEAAGRATQGMVW